MLKEVHGDFLFQRIDDPVFPNTCLDIQVQFANIVVDSIARRNNFHDPVRRAGTAFVRELVWVADDTDIRFHDRPPVIEQLDGKWSRVDFAGTFLGVDVITDFLYKKAYDLLMDAVWRCHVVEFAIDQLGTHIIGEGVIVFLCK